MFNITNGRPRLLRRPPLRRPLRFHRTRRPQSQTSLARCCSPRQQRQHPQVRRVQDGEQQVLYEQQMQDQQQVHSPSKQRRTSHTQQPLTSGAELALCPHAQQATHCAPSRTRRNPHACAQDMWHALNRTRRGAGTVAWTVASSFDGPGKTQIKPASVRACLVASEWRSIWVGELCAHNSASTAHRP